jgi:hypothetical protein
MSEENKIGIASAVAIKPGDQGQLRVRLDADARITGVEVEAGGEVTRILAGRDTILLAEGQTWTELLKSRGPSVASGSYVIVLVKNTTEEEKVFTGSLLVGDALLAPAAPRAVRPPGTDRTANTTVVQRKANVRPPVTVDRIVKPARVRSFNAPTGGEEPTTSASGRLGLPLVGVAPKAGEHVAILSPSHARAILALAARRLPIYPAFRAAIVKHLTSALERDGAATLYEGSSEVLVVLDKPLLSHLIGLVRGNMGPLTERGRAAVVKAIEEAFTRDARRSETSASKAKALGPGPDVIDVAATGT